MILFIVWPFPFTLFFGITALSLVILLVLQAYAKGRVRFVTNILIPLVSVLSFIGFLIYLSTTLMRSCEPEVTQSIVLTIVLFVVLLTGFIYLSRKKEE